MAENNTCKTCVHRLKMESGKGFAMYCDVLHSSRTKNGHLRVKCNQPCCNRYSFSEFGGPIVHNVKQYELNFE